MILSWAMIAIILSFGAPALAALDICERSHLTVTAPDIQPEAKSAAVPTEAQLEQMAQKLASFRLQSQSSDVAMADKNSRDLEFQKQYEYFISVVGSKSKAIEIFQNQMRKFRFEKNNRNTQQEKKEKANEENERREKERWALDADAIGRKIYFVPIPPGSFSARRGSGSGPSRDSKTV